LAKIGLDINYVSRWTITRQVAELAGAIPQELPGLLRNTRDYAQKLLESVEKIQANSE